MTMRLLQTATFSLACLLMTAGAVIPAPVHAQTAVEVVGAPTLEEILAVIGEFTGISAGADEGLELKEFALDKIAQDIAKQLLEQMTADIVDWINGGFTGEPQFVTDPLGMLGNIKTGVLEEFLDLENGDLAFLCSSFKPQLELQLRIAFEQPFGGERGTGACTLDEVVENVDNFLAGDWASGGWDGWFELAVRQQNPYGLYLEAHDELSRKILDAQGVEETLWDWGDGFLPLRGCIRYSEDNSACLEYGDVETPGAAIESVLFDALGSPIRQLELADELNEIVSALMNQMLGQVFGGIGGLSGLSLSGNSGGGGGGTFTDRLRGGTPQSYSTGVGSGGPYDTAINYESRYRAANTSALSSIESTRVTLSGSAGCVAAASYASSAIASTLNPLSQAYQARVASSDQNLSKLNSIIVRIETAATPQAAQTAQQEFIALQSSGELHGVADAIDAELARNNVSAQMTSIRNTFSSRKQQCQPSGGTGSGSGGGAGEGGVIYNQHVIFEHTF